MSKVPYNMIGVGLAIGVAIGVSLNNIALGIGVGVAISAGLASTQMKKENSSSGEDIVIDLNQMSRRKRKAKKDEE